MSQKTEMVGLGDAESASAALGGKSLVLVGLMGAGKSVIGRMSAQALGLPFVDTDSEIESVSTMTISELFESYGEPEFRALEARVIGRLMTTGPCVLSTGGGAFIDPETRALVKNNAVSLWLKADLDVLWDRVRKRDTRPLLRTENPKQTLKDLMDKRYPVYAEADLTVVSRDVRKEVIVGEVLSTLSQWGARK